MKQKLTELRAARELMEGNEEVVLVLDRQIRELEEKIELEDQRGNVMEIINQKIEELQKFKLESSEKIRKMKVGLARHQHGVEVGIDKLRKKELELINEINKLRTPFQNRGQQSEFIGVMQDFENEFNSALKILDKIFQKS